MVTMAKEHKAHLRDDTSPLLPRPLCNRQQVLNLVETDKKWEKLDPLERCAACARRRRQQVAARKAAPSTTIQVDDGIPAMRSVESATPLVLVAPLCPHCGAQMPVCPCNAERGGPMAFIQVTEIVPSTERNGISGRRDLWVNFEDVQSIFPLVAERCQGANCMITSSVGGNRWVEETAGKVALMLEEAECKQGPHVLAAALKEHAKALSLKWG